MITDKAHPSCVVVKFLLGRQRSVCAHLDDNKVEDPEHKALTHSYHEGEPGGLEVLHIQHIDEDVGRVGVALF